MESAPVFVIAKNDPRRDVLVRIASTFLDQPGLRLTLPQAQRLWNLEPGACVQHLKELIDAEFLQIRNAQYQLRIEP
jgi:hypothetical protein